MSSPPIFPLTADNAFSPVRRMQPFSRRKAVLYALICALWLLFGIFGRDPWKPEETLLTAAIADLLQGLPDSAAHYGLNNFPPLYILLTAESARLTSGFLPLHEGARLANVLLLGGGFAFLWLAAHRHYGVRIAWLTLLLLIGCFGFMVRAHQLNFGIAAFFGMTIALAGGATLADKRRTVNQVLSGGILIGIAAVFLLFSYNLFSALVALAILFTVRKEQIAAFLIAAVVFVPALVIAHVQGTVPLVLISEQFSVAALPGIIGDTLRVAAWSLLPLLPLVLYGLWYNRRQRLETLPRLCLIAILGGFMSFFIGGDNEEDYYLLLPPLALLAGYLLMKIPDDVASVMDFFALLIIGLCVVSSLWGIWLVITWQMTPLLAILNEQMPGYSLPAVSAWKVIAAALLTGGWIALLCRFGRSKERAVVNWSCGITLVWSVFNLLLAGYVDSGKSYRQTADQVRRTIGSDCLSAPDSLHWRAQLAYFGVLLGDNNCRYYLADTASAAAILHLRRNSGEAGYYLYRRI